MSANKKDINRFIDEVIAAGWGYNEGKHSRKLTHPKGDVVFINKTPSCPFALNNIKADINRVRRKYNEPKFI